MRRISARETRLQYLSHVLDRLSVVNHAASQTQVGLDRWLKTTPVAGGSSWALASQESSGRPNDLGRKSRAAIVFTMPKRALTA